jgi:hypothetical protein
VRPLAKPLLVLAGGHLIAMATPSTAHAQPAPEGSVRVHLDAPDAARLLRYDPGFGDGLQDSSAFRLAGAPGRYVTVTVDAGWKAWRVVGIVLIPVGAVAMSFGSLMGLLGTVADGSGSWQATLGWCVAVAGVAGLAGGIALVVSNRHTNVDQKTVAANAPTLQGRAWAAAPAWREPSPEQRAWPAAIGLPVLGGTF